MVVDALLVSTGSKSNFGDWVIQCYVNEFI